MAQAPHALRRRAAVAVLGARLDDAALLQELWFQHDTMRGEAVADLIAFVDAVADRHLFDAATRKRLYTEFFQALRQPPDTLPLDPWPAMQATRAPAPAPVAAPASPPPAPVAVSPASLQPVAAAMAAVAAPAALATPTPPPAPVDAAPSMVFGAVLRHVVAEVRGHHPQALDETAKDALAGLANLPVAAACASAFRAAWAQPREHDWQLPGSATDLAMLLRALHQALTESFGRVGAEQILQRALSAAERLPEAREFAPRRLLAAL